MVLLNYENERANRWSNLGKHSVVFATFHEARYAIDPILHFTTSGLRAVSNRLMDRKQPLEFILRHRF